MPAFGDEGEEDTDGQRGDETRRKGGFAALSPTTMEADLSASLLENHKSRCGPTCPAADFITLVYHRQAEYLGEVPKLQTDQRLEWHWNGHQCDCADSTTFEVCEVGHAHAEADPGYHCGYRLSQRPTSLPS